MKFVKKPVSFQAAGLLLAGMALLTVPAVAQQEVAPDHFDEKPAVSQSRKPVSRKAAEARTKSVSSHASTQAKSKPAQAGAPVLKADVGTSQAGQSPR